MKKYGVNLWKEQQSRESRRQQWEPRGSLGISSECSRPQQQAWIPSTGRGGSGPSLLETAGTRDLGSTWCRFIQMTWKLPSSSPTALCPVSLESEKMGGKVMNPSFSGSRKEDRVHRVPSPDQAHVSTSGNHLPFTRQSVGSEVPPPEDETDGGQVSGKATEGPLFSTTAASGVLQLATTSQHSLCKMNSCIRNLLRAAGSALSVWGSDKPYSLTLLSNRPSSEKKASVFPVALVPPDGPDLRVNTQRTHLGRRLAPHLHFLVLCWGRCLLPDM